MDETENCWRKFGGFLLKQLHLVLWKIVANHFQTLLVKTFFLDWFQSADSFQFGIFFPLDSTDVLYQERGRNLTSCNSLMADSKIGVLCKWLLWNVISWPVSLEYGVPGKPPAFLPVFQPLQEVTVQSQCCLLSQITLTFFMQVHNKRMVESTHIASKTSQLNSSALKGIPAVKTHPFFNLKACSSLELSWFQNRRTAVHSVDLFINNMPGFLF